MDSFRYNLPKIEVLGTTRGVMRIAVLAIACLLFAGCSENDNDRQSDRNPQFDPTSPQGDFTREESEIDVQFDPIQRGYVATQTVTVSNELGSMLDAALSNSVGTITVEAGSDGAYLAEFTLTGRGATEDEARRALATMTAHHTEDAGSTTETETWVEYAEYNPPQSQLGLLNGGRSADIRMEMPRVSDALSVDTSTGDMQIEGLRLSSLDVDTSTGDPTIMDVAASDVDLDGSTGDWQLDVQAGSFSMDTSTGHVDGVLEPLQSATWDLDVSTGDINLQLKTGNNLGYDLMASTSTGTISIDVPGTERVDDGSDEDEAHYRTTGFGDKDVQVTFDVGTSTGDVTLG